MILITLCEWNDLGFSYAEWTRDGVSCYGYADPINDEELIPDDVRETIALLIAPSLKAKLNV